MVFICILLRKKKKEMLRAVATDGHRLSRLSASLPKNVNNLEGVIIPRKTVTEIKKIIDNQDGQVKIQIAKNKIKFSIK